MKTWKVELYKDGAKRIEILEAMNQMEACEMAEYRAPGYYASSAQENR